MKNFQEIIEVLGTLDFKVKHISTRYQSIKSTKPLITIPSNSSPRGNTVLCKVLKDSKLVSSIFFYEEKLKKHCLLISSKEVLNKVKFIDEKTTCTLHKTGIDMTKNELATPANSWKYELSEIKSGNTDYLGEYKVYRLDNISVNKLKITNKANK